MFVYCLSHASSLLPLFPPPLLHLSRELTAPLCGFSVFYTRSLRRFLRFQTLLPRFPLFVWGRHASKLTEEEEDEEYLKEEEAGAGHTRLLVQPSCITGKMKD
ncbi:hypothetical protein L1887_28677 [Cichorium endivia]|nr:hypothetical protein L1887_28677 [Cichorium endivia]